MSFTLKETFFKRKEIRKLRKMAGGDTLVLVYIKLLIKSSDDDGNIYYDFTEKDIYEQLSLEIDEEYSDIETLLKFLYEEELITIISNSVIKLNYLEEGRDRNSKEYKQWRNKVFQRDDYTCNKCHKRGGKIQAHHIKPWALYIDDRFNVDNGITLCNECHRQEHSNNKRK